MIKIIFADGSKLEDLELNGNVYISKTGIDTSLFTSAALRSMTELDTNTGCERIFKDVVFAEQRKEEDGWHLTFYEKSQQEKMREQLEALNDSFERILHGLKYVIDRE